MVAAFGLVSFTFLGAGICHPIENGVLGGQVESALNINTSPTWEQSLSSRVDYAGSAGWSLVAKRVGAELIHLPSSILGPIKNASALNEKVTGASWDSCLEKGRNFACYFTPEGNAPSSPYTDFAMLDRYGWRLATYLIDAQDMPGLRPALAGLGVATDDASYPTVEWQQAGGFKNTDGRSGPATYAHYRARYGAQNGVIINVNLKSPKAAVQDSVSIFNPEAAATPDLQRYSDVIWLQWAKSCQEAGVSPGSLRFILNHYVTTDVTREVVSEVLKRRGNKALSVWPGLEVDMNSDEGLALLGTPHGYDIAWLLLNHKAAIPKKIGSMVIFTDTPGSDAPVHLAAKLVGL